MLVGKGRTKRQPGGAADQETAEMVNKALGDATKQLEQTRQSEPGKAQLVGNRGAGALGQLVRSFAA